MYKKWKCLLLLLLALSLLLACAATAAAQQDILIPEPTQTTEPTEQVREYTVTRGAFSAENNVRAELYYPLSKQVLVESYDAVLVEYLVEEGDSVNAGDTLATIRVETDPVTQAQMELRLRQAEDSFAQEVSRREDSIAELKRSIDMEEDALSREILALELRRGELSLEQYRYQQENTLQTQRDELARYIASAAATPIVSPTDGIITVLWPAKPGDPLLYGMVLAVISDTNEVLLHLPKVSYAYFGSTITATFANTDSSFTLTGTAVGTDNLRTDSKSTLTCYMRLDGFDPTATFKTVKATVPMLRCSNVLLIPLEAVIYDQETRSYYVMKRLDGAVVKTQVQITSYQDGENTLVIAGLEEGDVLVIG